MDETLAASVAKLSYEEALKALEGVVAALESEEHPLEESLTLYARGQALLQHCRRLLQEAELKVQRLAGDEVVPFSDETA